MALFCVQGMRRMFMDIDDISVDVPSAPTLLAQIVTKLKAAGTLSDELATELHSRSVMPSVVCMLNS